MRGRNVLELNCGSMIQLAQLYLNDHWLSKGDDLVPHVFGVEFVPEDQPQAGAYSPGPLNKMNIGRFRFYMDDVHSGVAGQAPRQQASPQPVPTKATP